MPPLRHRSVTAEDSDLITRIREGDTSAFETLFYSYFAAVIRFALSFVSDHDVAEDLAQEVFGWVWLHRAEWTPSSDILSYLLAAVRNRALDVIRTEGRRNKMSVRYVELGESPAMATPVQATDTMVEDDERNAAIWRLVSTLPEQRRTVILLRWRYGLDWDEIARLMGTSVAAVRMNHSRALQTLRRRLPDAIE